MSPSSITPPHTRIQKRPPRAQDHSTNGPLPQQPRATHRASGSSSGKIGKKIGNASGNSLALHPAPTTPNSSPRRRTLRREGPIACRAPAAASTPGSHPGNASGNITGKKIGNVFGKNGNAACLLALAPLITAPTRFPEIISTRATHPTPATPPARIPARKSAMFRQYLRQHRQLPAEHRMRLQQPPHSAIARRGLGVNVPLVYTGAGLGHTPRHHSSGPYETSVRM